MRSATSEPADSVQYLSDKVIETRPGGVDLNVVGHVRVGVVELLSAKPKGPISPEQLSLQCAPTVRTGYSRRTLRQSILVNWSWRTWSTTRLAPLSEKDDLRTDRIHLSYSQDRSGH